MSALIVTPGAAARMLTHKLPRMLILAVIFSVFSGVAGAYVSYANAGMPTGPWVVLFLSLVILLCILFAPKRGILYRIRQDRMNHIKILHENILKAIYQFHEKQDLTKLTEKLSVDQLLETRNFNTSDLMKGLKRLYKNGFILQEQNLYYLTESGKKESRRIVRLHRLWEQYLLKKTRIDSDHVHSGAEAIEHVITPEMEIELVKELGISGIPLEDY